MTRSLSILAHGLSKVGKSTFAASCPKPLLYLDVEGGTRFLQLNAVHWDPMTQAPPECDGTWDTAVVVVRDYAAVAKAYEWLNSGQHCFESVAIDSISELQQRLVDKISNRAQMQMQDWGTVFRDFIGLMRDYHSLTMHPTKPLQAVVYVSMSKEDDSGMYQPLAQGQSRNYLPYIVDVLGAMTVESGINMSTGEPTTSHKFTTGPHLRYATGERTGGRIPQVLDNATVPLLLDYVFGVEPSSSPAPVESTTGE